MDGEGVLTNEEDGALCKYILDMVEARLLFTSNQIKEKVVKMTKERPTFFKEGMPKRS